MTTWLAVCAGAYAVGSASAAIIVLRLAGKSDPRAAGSGNAGASNVRRLAGPAWAVVVLLADLARAAAVAWAALRLLPPAAVPLVGLALVLGNRFPLFHGFRGGKGVATWLGFVAWLNPLAAAFSGASWVVVWALGRVPWIGSLAMVAALAGGLALRCGPSPASLIGVALTLALIVGAHAPNFRTMLR